MSDLDIQDQVEQVTLQPPRNIKWVNWEGLNTLIKKETGRFLIVYMQTLIAPVVTTLLFYAIIMLALGGAERMVHGVNFMHFLAPGLIMMGMTQNAFANSSSSMIISKVQGNIVDILLPPLSSFEIYAGFIIGALVRGVMVGALTALAIRVFVPFSIAHVGLVFLYSVLGCVLLGAIGLAAGIWAEKFDHVAAITNFIISPMTFLSGTFYSVDALPQIWQKITMFNPFFYMIDGFRYAFIGQSDGSILIGISFLVGMNALVAVLIFWMLNTGYKIKS